MVERVQIGVAARKDALDGVDPWPMADRCARKGWQNGGAGIKPSPHLPALLRRVMNRTAALMEVQTLGDGLLLAGELGAHGLFDSDTKRETRSWNQAQPVLFIALGVVRDEISRCRDGFVLMALLERSL